jgi:hypothetical protein
MNNPQVTFPYGDVRNTFDGFSKLAELHATLDPYMFETIEIDFSHCTWFDANMSAPLGVVLARAIDELNTIKLCRIPGSIQTILAKNRFLESFGFQARPDTYGTTIQYQRFSASDERLFAAYLSQHLRGLPAMSDALSTRFKRNLFEIFVNASMHAESESGIFACGQFFPAKHKMDFSIADAGIGIRRKIIKELGLSMNSDRAIQWALQEGNTTRKGNVPGGLGLKLIREFITLNQGCIQIVSDRGFWEFSPEGETLTRFAKPFPGTVINIEINTADTSNYCLSSEAWRNQRA